MSATSSTPWDRRAQDLTPRAIVEELDRYIVGQKAAKRAVAIALRNRWRRQQVPPPMRDEIAPKNIMLIGPTGVGKTEIARRLAQAGGRAVHQGRGVEVHRGRLRRPRRRFDGARPGRDRGVDAARGRARAACGRGRARTPRSGCSTCCCRRRRAQRPTGPANMTSSLAPAPPPVALRSRRSTTRPARTCASLLREGKLDDKMVEIDTADAPPSFVDVFSGTGMEEMVLNLRDMFPQGARRTKRRRLSVPEALEHADGRGGGEARSTSNGCRRTRSAAPSRPGSSSSTRSTRSRGANRAATVRTSRARACSATCCRSSRGRRCRPSTAR